MYTLLWYLNAGAPAFLSNFRSMYKYILLISIVITCSIITITCLSYMSILFCLTVTGSQNKLFFWYVVLISVSYYFAFKRLYTSVLSTYMLFLCWHEIPKSFVYNDLLFFAHAGGNAMFGLTEYRYQLCQLCTHSRMSVATITVHLRLYHS